MFAMAPDHPETTLCSKQLLKKLVRVLIVVHSILALHLIDQPSTGEQE